VFTAGLGQRRAEARVPIQDGAPGIECEGLSLTANPEFAAALSPKPRRRAWSASHEIDRSGTAGIGIRLLISYCWHAG
jgi:hypothetical protein